MSDLQDTVSHVRANVVDAEIPKEMSKFAEPKTLTERSISNALAGQPSGERRTNEGREMPARHRGAEPRTDVKRRRV